MAAFFVLQRQLISMERQIRARMLGLELLLFLLGLALFLIGGILVYRGAALGWIVIVVNAGCMVGGMVWLHLKAKELCSYLQLLPYLIMTRFRWEQT